MATKISGYRINYTDNMVILNYKFAKRAETDFGSPEAKMLRQIKEAFPTFGVMVKAGKEITTTRPTKRLTYANMELFMTSFENYDDLLEQYTIVRTRSLACASPYKYVRDWFEAQFPNYKDCLTFSGIESEKKNRAVKIIEIPNIAEYKTKNDDKENEDYAV